MSSQYKDIHGDSFTTTINPPHPIVNNNNLCAAIVVTQALLSCPVFINRVTTCINENFTKDYVQTFKRHFLYTSMDPQYIEPKFLAKLEEQATGFKVGYFNEDQDTFEAIFKLIKEQHFPPVLQNIAYYKKYKVWNCPKHKLSQSIDPLDDGNVIYITAAKQNYSDPATFARHLQYEIITDKKLACGINDCIQKVLTFKVIRYLSTVVIISTRYIGNITTPPYPDSFTISGKKYGLVAVIKNINKTHFTVQVKRNDKIYDCDDTHIQEIPTWTTLDPCTLVYHLLSN